MTWWRATLSTWPALGRYTRANPLRRLLTTFACPNQSVAGRLEVAIKKLGAIDKKKLVGKSGAEARKALLRDRPLRAHVKQGT